MLFAVFIVYSLLSGFKNSLYSMAYAGNTFVGIDNYADLFSDEVFLYSLFNTVVFVVAIVGLTVLAGLWISSTVFDKNTKFVTFIRTAYYIPTIVSMVVMSMIWSYLLNSSGLISYYAQQAGFGSINFLGDPLLAKATVIFVTFTANIGTAVVLYIAAMAGISVDTLEAAEIDGVTRWQKVRLIVVPQVKATTSYILITNIVGVLKLFVVINLLTGGGPTYSTTTLMYYLYQNAFKYGKMGKASAIGVIMFFLALLCSIPYVRSILKKDD